MADKDRFGIEIPNPEENNLYWMSFADENKHLGLAIILAKDELNAVLRTVELNINPGGECRIWLIPDDKKNMALHEMTEGKLYQKEDFKEGELASSRDHPEEEFYDSDTYKGLVCEHCNKIHKKTEEH